MSVDLVVRGRRVVARSGIGPASIHVEKGVIEAIRGYDDVPPGAHVVEAGEDAVVLPGLVDSHVHVNEPGRTEWEGFETATRAAAAGGITTIVDMPLNSDPVTTTLAALREKARAAKPRAWVDTGFWGGVVPGNSNELEPLVRAGARGFKCFLVHSGIDDFPEVREEDLRVAMPILARLGSTLLVHAEVPGPIEEAARKLAASGASSRRYSTFLASRPRAAEDEAVATMIRLSRETGCRVHIVHLSSADAVPLIEQAWRDGVLVSAETCPHYLTFEAEEVQDGATHWKCCPPIRERENRERLWDALGRGVIELVVSDHSPCTPSLKCLDSGDFSKAWGGISALQLSLPLVWTGARARGFSLERLVAWMARGPAKLAGLSARKGEIAPGLDADLVLFRPDATFVPTAETLHHRHKLTPASGRTLNGVVDRVFLRGREVFSRGAFGEGPSGVCILASGPETKPDAASELVDLAAERTGGVALAASDEFFAPKENLLKAAKPIWVEDRYTDRGKWMDGWESRRKRVPGHDWCLVKLGLPGRIRSVTVDTSWFKGNFPESCSLEACAQDGDPTVEDLEGASWTLVLPKVTLRGDSANVFPVESAARFTHLRLNIFPDGGVARLRVHGEVLPDWRRVVRFSGNRVDLAAIENGGAVVACNDMFFGSRHNLILPGRSLDMRDGWETRRRRKLPGSDWTIVRLGAPGQVASVEVDTNHFKGNFPESFQLDGCEDGGARVESLADPARAWRPLIARTKLRAHARHFFDEIAPHGTITHARLTIFPDGGVSRLRLLGTPSAAFLARAELERLCSLDGERAVSELLRCCGSRAWAASVAEKRPFRDEAALLAAAEDAFSKLGRDDWLEAFRAHPRIGSRKDLSRQDGETRAWAESEQKGARAASAATSEALERANRDYEARFGHIYIVCATGKTADEMLALARARLANDPSRELEVAAAEQAKITRLRLEKLLRP